MSEDAHNSDNQFDSRAWSNGELCPTHGMPYCSPCMRMQLGKGIMGKGIFTPEPIESPEDRMTRLRGEIIRRIRTGEYHHSQFHRPVRRNFFEDKRRQFAATCQVGKGHHILLPLAFVIVGDDDTAHRATDEEVREILLNEHRWDTSTPEWAQHDVPTLEDEDTVLLREFQLFKS